MNKSQKQLAKFLLSTKTHAKVRRKKQNPDGTYEFYYVTRDTSPIDFRIDPSEFAFVHHEKHPQAPLSPNIVNLRNLPDSLNKQIAQVMAEIPLKQIPNFVSGIPNAAIPFAKEYSNITKIPYITIFAKDDQPGSPRILPAKDAPKEEGKTILIIDDVVTKAESKFRSFKVAEQLGYNVMGLIVLVDRGEGGKEKIEEAGYQFYAPFTLRGLLDYYFEKGSITQKQYNESIEYLKQSEKI